MASWPCSNPSCSSHGAPHPGCKCPPPYAAGGVVEHFCSSDRKHLPGCEYVKGGEVTNPGKILGHTTASKGLLGLLKDVGHASMQEPEKYNKVLNEAKEHHSAKKSDPLLPKPRGLGAKLGHHIAEGDHEKAGELLSGHPLAGLVGKTHMKQAMSHLAEPMITQEPHPKAFRSAVDYLTSASRGNDSLDKHVKGMMEPKKLMDPDHKNLGKLKQTIDELNTNPEKMLDLGGDLGHYLPGHNAELAATAARAVSYLSSLKPQNVQESPFDTVLPPSKAANAVYDRQLRIAQTPSLMLQHTKDGSLSPQDIATVQTIYPKLYNDMIKRVGEHLIDSTDKGMKVPYKMRSSLSLLLGQPLDSTMTSKSMQAIIQAGSPKAPQGAKTQNPKVSETELKATEKANKMLETPQQARLINKKP